MKYVVKLPDIGEGTTQAEIVGWRVKVGDIVREDRPLAELMTDKATVEIPSPVHGRSSRWAASRARSWRSAPNSSSSMSETEARAKPPRQRRGA